MSPSIAALISKYKLDAHRETISNGLVPAYRLATGKPGKGKSKLGGDPDLPSSTPWPTKDGRPLHFLAQLRLSEIPRGHLADLPPQGWVHLWYDTIEEDARNARTEINAADYDPPLAHLTFDPDESQRRIRRELPPLPDDLELNWCEWEPFKQVSFTFEPIWCLNAQATRIIMDAEEKADRKAGWDRVYAFLGGIENRQPGNAPNHRVLGDLYEMQTNSRFSAACAAAEVAEFADHSKTTMAALNRAAAEYRLLFLLDSDDDPGFVWGDAGSLQWWIRKGDLARGELDKAVGLYEQGG